MQNIKIEYGLKNDKLVSIFELSEKERGLKCNCVCPNCKGALVARLGEQNAHHFAHFHEECDILAIQETTLHIMAKEIIEKYKLVMFPPLYISFPDTNLYKSLNNEQRTLYNQQIKESFLAIDSQSVLFDTVYLEKKLSKITPDVIATVNGKQCFIEIAVSHFIDREKEEKIKQLKMPTIEIDLSCFLHDQIDKHKIKDIILNSAMQKKWIFNPKQTAKQLEAEIFYTTKIADLFKKRYETEQTFQKDNFKQKNRHKDNENLKTANHNELVKLLKNDDEFFKIYKSSSLFKYSEQPPFYLNIPIEYEYIFNCDRRIWQTILFENFVFNGNGYNFDLSDVENWILNHKNQLEINNQYSEFSENNDLTLFSVINKYLRYLEDLGFVKTTRYPSGQIENAKTIVSNTIAPPDKEGAKELEQFLKNSPFV